MTNKKYTDVVRKIYKALNDRDMDGWTEFFDEETIDYVAARKQRFTGRKVIREGYEEFIKGTPDAQFEFVNIFGQDNWVCAEGSVSGTFAATNKSFQFPICIVVKFDGEIVREFHEYFDQQGFQG